MRNHLIKNTFLIILTILSAISVAQNRSELEKKKNNAIKEIEYTNKLIRETEQGKKESVNNLNLINTKISARQELINAISSEISLIETTIKDNEMVISMLEEDLIALRNEYAKMIVLAYKNRNSYDRLMFILSSDDFNQAYKRLKYYQQYSDYRKKQAMAIKGIQVVLNSENEKLAASKQEKETLLAEKSDETNQLKQEKRMQNSTIQKLTKQEEDLRKTLRKYEETAAQLQREIEKLIAEEAKASSSSGTYQLTPAEKLISTNFGNNKGALPWPVERGVIVSSYGKHPHPVLGGVTIENAGVDIATAQGTQVRAIFEGEVRRVFTLPGAQNAVIIRHGNYLSVYTHLSKAFVKKGDKVETKQAIGEVYTDKEENKTIVHIEIWKENLKMNPAQWLAK
ncbi:MAG: peptidoglycan DD-metalloendopeptidase family protein [Bacteroidales bacterium]|jgi:septal ring factor EnvC (AmiA/AmiB activator)|nr:peptidoglycan DD-metalloendopeptidase family protein [Bacteroidales bacterium]